MNNSIYTLFGNILIDIHKFKSLKYVQRGENTRWRSRGYVLL